MLSTKQIQCHIHFPKRNTRSPRRVNPSQLIVICMVLLGGSVRPGLLAQTASSVKVELSSLEVQPGAEIFVLLKVEVPENNLPIQEITETVCFPDSFLQFMDVKPGAIPGTKFSHSIGDSGDCKKLVIEITFEESPASGILADLKFKVRENLPVGQEAQLKTKAEVRGPQGTIPATSVDSVLKVTDSPEVFACFFYMH